MTDDKQGQLIDMDELKTDIDEYIALTQKVLPDIAKQPTRSWLVNEDHCFQRIVLDNICGGVWYENFKNLRTNIWQ